MIISTLISAALLTSFSSSEIKTFTVDGVERKATIIAPSNPKNAPVIFGFHGHGGNMRNAQRSFKMEQVWPEAIVIYMEGLPTKTPNDPRGQRNGWQVSARIHVDRDLKFFDAVWKDTQAKFKPNNKQVFAMGHSNGGRFTYLLWAERPNVFKAFAPSGSPALRMNLTPKPAFHLMGETDAIVSPDDQKTTIEKLKKLNGCNENGKAVAQYTTRFAGKNGNDVETFIHPGGHNYPAAAPRLIVDFWKSLK